MTSDDEAEAVCILEYAFKMIVGRGQAPAELKVSKGVGWS